MTRDRRARLVPDVVVARGEVRVIVGREELLGALAWLRDDPDLSLGLPRRA